jgi:oxygen-independent coproporphyrinogen III oxidase
MYSWKTGLGSMVNIQDIFNPALIKKYDTAGPRYTSYPTAVEFSDDFNANDYEVIARNTNASGCPLSLYVHIPFCDTVCFYCACNKIATKDRTKSPVYLQQLYTEIERQGALFDYARPVDQLHFGGGTPTFLNDQELRDLMRVIGKNFQLRDDDSGEYSIEIDPREAGRDTVALLRELGFNRMSLGLQDFDPKVQQAVNRIQTEEQTFATLDAARENGFHSISVDLIYGLPFQHVDSFNTTLDKVLAVRPDRLSIFNYAHLPHIFKPQRRIDEAYLPSPAEKLEIFQAAMERLGEAGYEYIGMDHFALPDDELAVAQRQGSLYRNFQGYSTHSNCDLIGLGVSAISMVGDCYAQNVKTVEEYAHALEQGGLGVFRGVRLDADDIVRREVITQLICNFVLNFATIESRYNITFTEYFAQELDELANMEADGLIQRAADKLVVQPPGRLLIRNICMVFDKYMRIRQGAAFSKVI